MIHAHKDSAEWVRHPINEHREECCPQHLSTAPTCVPEETRLVLKPRRFCAHGLPYSPGSCRATCSHGLPFSVRFCCPPPLPFLETAFGKIPPEVRLQIFRYVLTVSPATLKDDLSVPMVRDYRISTLGKLTQSVEQKSRSPSCLALVSTCRQIYKESCGVFYSSNTLFLGNSHDLLAFLTSIQTVRREHIVSLHLSSLTTEAPAWKKDCLDEMIREEVPGFTEEMREELEKQTKTVMAPNAVQARPLLAECRKLHKLYLDAAWPDEREHIAWLTSFPNWKENIIDFKSHLHWKLTAGTIKGPYLDGWYAKFLERQYLEWEESDSESADEDPDHNRDERGKRSRKSTGGKPRRIDFNPNRLSWGSVQRFEVDILSPPEMVFLQIGTSSYRL